MNTELAKSGEKVQTWKKHPEAPFFQCQATQAALEQKFLIVKASVAIMSINLMNQRTMIIWATGYLHNVNDSISPPICSWIVTSILTYIFIIICRVSWPPDSTVVKHVGLESDTCDSHSGCHGNQPVNLVSLTSMIGHIAGSIGWYLYHMVIMKIS